jgi:arsenical pump membrane protein
LSEGVALFALALCLAASVARWSYAPDWLVAALAATVLVAAGVVGVAGVRESFSELGPTVAFLAALLVVADGCRRAGLFEAIGELIAVGARGRPPRLLAMVFAAASLTTVVLSLDATIVLLTPMVLVTAARLRCNPRPHLYACAHLANSASLLLPISNLTNLIAFHDSRLSFLRFAGLMALPWLAALVIELIVLRRVFADELGTAPVDVVVDRTTPVPAFALGTVALMLAGFAASSALGVAPVWIAAAAAAALVLHERPAPREVVRASAPTFLIFVLALAVVVRGAGVHGLSSAIDAVLPHGVSLPALLAVAGVSAVAANLVNNLPATLIILPAAAAIGPGAVLAMLVGVNVGPNLTYVGSLATLLWRRVLHEHGEETDLRRFTFLGLVTVPPILVASTAGLWLALQVI